MYTIEEGHRSFESIGRFIVVYLDISVTTTLYIRVLYTYIFSLYNVHLLTAVDVVPLMKTAGVVENSGHCIYSIGLMCFFNYLSLFHLVLYLLLSNTRYFVDQLERFTYLCMHIYNIYSKSPHGGKAAD